MSSTLTNVLLLVILFATQVVVTDWLTRNVLEVASKRPLRAAAATLFLTGLTLGPAAYGVDALLGGSLSSLSRVLLCLTVGVAQTGLVLRLIYGTGMPLAFVHGLILHLTWGAVSVLIMLCDRLGDFYFAAPLLFILAAHVTKRVQDRDLVRRLSSIPPTAPNVRVAQR